MRKIITNMKDINVPVPRNATELDTEEVQKPANNKKNRTEDDDELVGRGLLNSPLPKFEIESKNAEDTSRGNKSETTKDNLSDSSASNSVSTLSAPADSMEKGKIKYIQSMKRHIPSRKKTTRRSSNDNVELVIDPNVKRRTKKFRLRGRPQNSEKREVTDSITLRKRQGDSDTIFWILAMLGSLFALGILSCITYYLSRTDFFSSHQNELLGATVDERFTVVSPRETSANIFLKSGYSNSPYAEGLLELKNGVLRLGRTKMGGEDAVEFYGFSIFTNGTVSYTNEVTAPKLVATHVHATEGLTFKDGTTMTTAADISGGMKQVGDLNFASEKGAVVSTTAGKERFRVNSDGTIVMLNPTAVAPLDPSSTGITFNAPEQKIIIADDLKLYYTKSGSGITASQSFHLGSDVVTIGNGADVVTLKCPDGDKGSSRSANAKTFQVIGQSVYGSGSGGNLVLAGGDGDQSGGTVILQGGKSRSNPNIYGSIEINTNPQIEARSVIGAKTKFSHTELNGNVLLNTGVEDDSISFSVGGKTEISGSSLNVTAKQGNIGDPKTTIEMHLNGQSLFVGGNSGTVGVGNRKNTVISMLGKSVQVDGDAVDLGAGGTKVSIGSLKTKSVISVAGGTLDFKASNDIRVNWNSNHSSTSIKGRVQIGENQDIQVWDGTTTLGGEKVNIGTVKTTGEISIASSKISMSSTSNGKIDIGSTDNNAYTSISGSFVSLISTGKIAIGQASNSKQNQVSINGNEINLNATSDISIGNSAQRISIGNSRSNQAPVRLFGNISFNNGKVLFDTSLSEITMGSKKINIGIDSATSKIEIGPKTESIEIGKVETKEIHIGSEGGKIYFHGEVTVNGNKINGARRLAEEESVFLSSSNKIYPSHAFSELPLNTEIFMESKKEIVIPFTTVQNLNSEAFDKHITISDSSIRVPESMIAQVSFSLYGLIIRKKSSESEKQIPQDGIMTRCRMYDGNKVLLEASTRVGVCWKESIDLCKEDDDMMLMSLNSLRVLSLEPSNSIIMTCKANDKQDSMLHFDSAQLSIIEMTKDF